MRSTAAILVFCILLTQPFYRCAAAIPRIAHPDDTVTTTHVRQISEEPTTFYSYMDILGSYELETTRGSVSRCPKTMLFTEVIGPDFNKTFSYQLHHNKIFAEGNVCSPWAGPFLSVYSFLQNAQYVPGDFISSVQGFSVGNALYRKFSDNGVTNQGGRAYFGYDATTRQCGNFKFQGANGHVTTVTIFFAHKELITLDPLGYFNAGRKHMITIMRDASSTVTMCSYSAKHAYWDDKIPPTQFLNPSATPTPTPTSTTTPSATPSSTPTLSITPTPSVSMTVSQSVGATSTPSPSLTSSTHSTDSPTPTTTSTPSASVTMSKSTQQGSVSGATSSGGNSGGSACFPASALVSLRNQGARRIDDLELGDEVLVSFNSYSPVFMFTHKLSTGSFQFLRFVLEDGSELRVTPGHFVYADRVIKAARDVRVNDTMENANAQQIPIKYIETVHESGLYNPQTEHGDIIVNGIRVSTFTESIEPSAAHALLSVFRCLRRNTGIMCGVTEKQWELGFAKQFLRY